MKEGLLAGQGPGTSGAREQIRDGRKLRELNAVSRLTRWVGENQRQKFLKLRSAHSAGLESILALNQRAQRSRPAFLQPGLFGYDLDRPHGIRCK